MTAAGGDEFEVWAWAWGDENCRVHARETGIDSISCPAKTNLTTRNATMPSGTAGFVCTYLDLGLSLGCWLPGAVAEACSA